MIRFLQRSLAQHLSTAKNTSKPMVDYAQRGQYRGPLSLKKGDQIDGFEVMQCRRLPDFQIEAAVMKCRENGTEWVHLDCEEEKNTMAFVVKCPQVPHMVKLGLQKMLQCGSKKYPVRNPIQFMARRSFNSQNLSSSTNDYIMYAYQTPLLKDHHNLMQVFLNMMFDPLFREQDFKQIVWRYTMRDGKTLGVEGQTVNEIKSSYYFSQMRVFDAIQRELLGRGGINRVSDVEKVCFGEFLGWHKKVFHPRNLLILSHGDLHPAKLISKYRQITKNFNFTTHQSKVQQTSPQQKQQHTIQESKTIKIEQLQTTIPLILSFQLENLSLHDRILLSILSSLLYDMPESPMMRWNTPQTPFPKHYGFQGNYFNIGVTLQKSEKQITGKQFLEVEKDIRACLEELCSKKIPDHHIERCLLHLQGEYYSKDGIRIITGCLDNLLQFGAGSVGDSLEVKTFIARTLRNYRKENIFEALLRKYIVDNKKHIRIWGYTNPDLIQDLQFDQSVRLKLKLSKLDEKEVQQIGRYRPGDMLQDYKILPKIDIAQYQIFEQKSPLTFKVNGVPVYHCHKCDGIKMTIKYDITDIEQEQMKLIPILCDSYPWMGGKGITTDAYRNYFQMYIRKIQMKFQTARTGVGMRLYLYLSIEFSDRNAQYGFNLFSNLINDHNHDNLEALSETIQKRGSQIYNELSENLIEIHGRHIGGTRSPYSMMEDPIFMARSTCGLASQIRKISNPKALLSHLAQDLRKITDRFTRKNRAEVLFECKKSYLDKYTRYLQTIFNSMKQDTSLVEPIKDKDFTSAPCLKYFPNYQEQFVFQAFSVPYYRNLEELPATLVLSAVINQNIRRYNQNGGSFLFKGALIAYLRGSRKKVLELEDYYRKIEEIEEAKRSIFQQFRRYTAADIFYTGTTAEQARIFKQAVAMTDEKTIQVCLEKYILTTLKQGKSSVLAIGAHLGNYEPLIKKGWIIERSIEDLSLHMESHSIATPQIETSKYINIY